MPVATIYIHIYTQFEINVSSIIKIPLHYTIIACLKGMKSLNKSIILMKKNSKNYPISQYVLCKQLHTFEADFFNRCSIQ